MPELATLLHPAVPDWSGRNRCLPSLLPPLWRDWLLDAGSLTARLSALRPGQFRVQLLAQYHGRPTPLERTELQLHGQHSVWVREVILLLGDTPLVYARTAVPITTLNGAGKHCKANALGLEWSRRSVFYLGDKPLMVSEAFTGALTDFL